MNDAQTNSRYRWLAPILLGLLVLVTLVAWMLTRNAQADWRRGVALIETIQEKGLGAYWPQTRTEQWYLRYGDHGQPVGWRLMTRKFEDGAYVGKDYFQDDSGASASENWRISPDAKTCEYFALQNEPGRKTILTEINLFEGQIEIIPTRNALPAVATPPANYIPEGLNDLVSFLASKGKGQAACSILLNLSSVKGDQVYFFTVYLQPIRENQLILQLGHSKTHLEFDSEGQVTRIVEIDSGTEQRLVTYQDVLKHYPQVVRIRKELDAEAEKEDSLPNPEQSETSLL